MSRRTFKQETISQSQENERNMLLLITFLLSSSLQSTQCCSTEKDTFLKQIAFVVDECQCREYGEAYVICYGPYDCYKFPRNLKITLKCFKFNAALVKQISVGDLTNLSHLTSLSIDINIALEKIEPGVFKDMKNLVTLSISYNQILTHLDEDVFEGLENLETLVLRRDGFPDFKDFTSSLQTKYLPKLKIIHLKELNCPNLDKDAFVNLKGSRVTDIAFDDSQITYIHPEALLPLTNLVSLSVSETLMDETNLIEVLEKITEAKIPLTSLSLNGWGFKVKLPKKLFDVIANSTVKELFLVRNMLHTIDEHTFVKMPNIERLYLDENMIIDVKENAFSNLPNLKELHIKQNRLMNVPKGLSLPTIEILDVSTNIRDLSSYFWLVENQFQYMTSLKTLDMSNNNCGNLRTRMFNGLINLKTLYLYKCNIRVIFPNVFTYITNLEYLDLSQNAFPQRTFGKDIFKGLTNLKYLSLEGCKIDHIPTNDIFGHLTSLETLNLNQNYLMEITPEFITSLKTLKVFNVGENKIKVWQERLFKNSRVENLTAFRNSFTYLTEAMLEDFGQLKMINVANNPFLCECDNLVESFNSLTESKRNHVFNLLNASSTFCLPPESTKNTTIVSYYQQNYKTCQQNKIKRLINYLVPSILCVILLLSTLILSYIYRWHIRYWIFLTKLAISRRTQFKRGESVRGHTNYLYDAFVSYSTEDRNFVIKLVEMLENCEPYLKLCVYERDFEIGTIISESVLESLSKSRKTLLIISNSYIKSQWCTWEAQAAENRRLFFENENGECVNDSLIMIKLGNISNSNISPMLRYLMKTRVYLQWDPSENKQQKFWEKLRNALAPSASNSEEESVIDVKL